MLREDLIEHSKDKALTLLATRIERLVYLAPMGIKCCMCDTKLLAKGDKPGSFAVHAYANGWRVMQGHFGCFCKNCVPGVTKHEPCDKCGR